RPAAQFKIADGHFYPERISRYMDSAVEEAKSKEIRLDQLSRAIRAAQRTRELMRAQFAKYAVMQLQVMMYAASKANFFYQPPAQAGQQYTTNLFGTERSQVVEIVKVLFNDAFIALIPGA